MAPDRRWPVSGRGSNLAWLIEGGGARPWRVSTVTCRPRALELGRQIDLAPRPLGDLGGQFQERSCIASPGQYRDDLLLRIEDGLSGRVAGAGAFRQAGADPLSNDDVVGERKRCLTSEFCAIENPVTGEVKDHVLCRGPCAGRGEGTGEHERPEHRGRAAGVLPPIPASA